MRVSETVDRAPIEKDETWLEANVVSIWPGILTMAGSAGHGSGDLRAAGVPSTIEIVADPAGGSAITHAKVTITGMAEHVSDIASALKLLGNPRSLRWAGGPGEAPLKFGGGIPLLVDANAAGLPPADLVGGVAWLPSTSES